MLDKASPSHGRGPRFDPLCAHHQKPNKQGLFASSQNRYSATRDGTNRETRAPTRGLSVDFDHALFHLPRSRSWGRT